eukprot:PLAT10700.1.p1 GENE.PLAT10700.1~~PLAT10700.1.p1  ORF type:complete len:216 (-),score=74.68 PLAT10700.1:228-875(-)
MKPYSLTVMKSALLLFAAAFLLLLPGAAAVRNAAECEVCQKVTNTISAVLLRNATRHEEIKPRLTGLCELVPAELTTVCMESVEAVNMNMFRCLVRTAGFESLCSDPTVGLCDAPGARPSVGRCWGVDPSPLGCASCKFIGAALEQYLTVVRDRLVPHVTHLCEAHFAGDDVKKCQLVLDNYGERMVAILIGRLDPDDFCCNFGQCRTPPPKPAT